MIYVSFNFSYFSLLKPDIRYADYPIGGISRNSGLALVYCNIESAEGDWPSKRKSASCDKRKSSNSGEHEVVKRTKKSGDPNTRLVEARDNATIQPDYPAVDVTIQSADADQSDLMPAGLNHDINEPIKPKIHKQNTRNNPQTRNKQTLDNTDISRNNDNVVKSDNDKDNGLHNVINNENNTVELTTNNKASENEKVIDTAPPNGTKLKLQSGRDEERIQIKIEPILETGMVFKPDGFLLQLTQTLC